MALISLKICSPLPGITLKVFRCKRWQLKLVAARQHTKPVLSTVSRIRAEEDGISEENVKFEFANVLVKGLVLWIFIFLNSISIDGAIFFISTNLRFWTRVIWCCIHKRLHYPYSRESWTFFTVLQMAQAWWKANGFR